MVLKVWDNKWDCGGYTTPSRILRRLYQEKIIKNHQNCKYTKISPAMPTNQLTCTTNMILSHYMHRLWGLQRSKVLKSILHCSWEIFISPGNSSAMHITRQCISTSNAFKLYAYLIQYIYKISMNINFNSLSMRCLSFNSVNFALN